MEFSLIRVELNGSAGFDIGAGVNDPKVPKNALIPEEASTLQGVLYEDLVWIRGKRRQCRDLPSFVETELGCLTC